MKKIICKLIIECAVLYVLNELFGGLIKIDKIYKISFLVGWLIGGIPTKKILEVTK